MLRALSNSPRQSAHAILLAALFATPVRAQQPAPPDLDAYIARTMKTFEVPGLAVSIVKDGRVVMAKGYGVRRLGGADAVDAHTRFGIASNTKAFTATALGLLVEEGKVEWDAPVTRYLPWFALSDPYVTSQLTVRDLLVHRSGLGLGAGDLLWWPPSTYNRKEIAMRLRHIPLATSFRSAYAYDNVLYLVAGEVIEAVSGSSWEDFVKTRILDKVGMREATLRHSDAGGAGANVAATHARVDGVVRPIAPFTSDNTNPAGGINAGVDDMAKWMIVQLDSGRLADGSRLFSPRLSRALWSVVTPIGTGSGVVPAGLESLRANFNGYGLGFGLRDYRGKKLVQHTGGLPGYVSKVAMIPELRLGVVILTNAESEEAFDAIAYRVLDHYLGAAPVDYTSIWARLARESASSAANAAATGAKRDPASRPSLPLDAYAGRYVDAWYGDVAVALEQGKLVMRFSHSPQLSGELEHWRNDTFVARWRDRELRADAYVSFTLTPEGAVAGARMKAFDPATDFSYDFQDLRLEKR